MEINRFMFLHLLLIINSMIRAYICIFSTNSLLWKILWIHCNKVIALMTKMISDNKYTCVRKIKHVHCINKFKLLLKLDNTNNSSWVREIKRLLIMPKMKNLLMNGIGSIYVLMLSKGKCCKYIKPIHNTTWRRMKQGRLHWEKI